jgi:hypothetical protein
MLWGKYWQFVDDQRTRLWQSKCADGRSLCVVVGLQLYSQSKVSRLFFLLSLQPRLLVIADWSWAQRWHLVLAHAHSLQRIHSRPRIALVRMMRIIVRMHAIVRLARAIRSLVSGLVGSHRG